MTPDQALDLLKSGGAIIGAIYLLVKVIDFLRYVLSGITETLNKITEVVSEMRKNQVEHDKQLGVMYDTQLVTASGIKEQNTILKEQNTKLDVLQQTGITGNTFTKKLTETMVAFSQDSSEGLAATRTAIIENSNRIETAITARIDSLPGEVLTKFDEPLAKIREDLSKLIDPALATNIANALQPGLVALVEKVLVECLKQNDVLAKELDATEPLAVNIVTPDVEKPDPEPPTPPTPVAVINGETGDVEKRMAA